MSWGLHKWRYGLLGFPDEGLAYDLTAQHQYYRCRPLLLGITEIRVIPMPNTEDEFRVVVWVGKWPGKYVTAQGLLQAICVVRNIIDNLGGSNEPKP